MTSVFPNLEVLNVYAMPADISIPTLINQLIMKRYSFIILALILCSFISYSQNNYCGTDILRSLKAQDQPSLLLKEADANHKIYNGLLLDFPAMHKAGGSFVIPVVFHIMHNNGPENVNDSLVQQSVDELNLRFQNAAPFFDSTGHLVNIEFCLATVDPHGNPTNGITRHVTSLTNLTLSSNDDSALKNLARWSPDLYFNVYVVANITGFIDGYSTFPFNAGEPADGVVIEYYYINNSFLLAHETGHYCGLYHTFQNGCLNQNCLMNGDLVCDTPPDNSSQTFTCQGNSCTTDMDDTSGVNPFFVDMNELPNYMDYTTCPLSFSQGQSDRMEASVILLRDKFYLSNGCGNNPGVPAPVAAFNFTVSSCNNGKVSFSDSTTQNGITSEWDFDGDGLFEYIGHDFTYEFPASWTYQVTQRVTGAGGQDTISHIITVYKGLTANFPIEMQNPAVVDTVRVCEGSWVTFSGVTGGVSYLWSTGETTPSISFIADTSVNITLSMTDASGFTWSSQCTPIHVLVSPYQEPVISYIDTVGYYCDGDPVHLYVSNTLPGTYTWFKYTTSTGWVNTGVVDTMYIAYPNATYSSFYYAVYSNFDGSCTGQSNIVMLHAQYVPVSQGFTLNVNGNTMSYPVSNFVYQWYLNGSPIAGATTGTYTATQTGCYALSAAINPYLLCDALSDTVCFDFTNVVELAGNSYVVYPNPVREIVYIVNILNDNSDAVISLTDTRGREIDQNRYDVNTGLNTIIMNIRDLADGLYFLKITSNSRDELIKIVKSTNP